MIFASSCLFIFFLNSLLPLLWIHSLQIDLVKKKAKNWYEDGAIPSEPFFVARPGATEEDDGELLYYIILESSRTRNVLN